MADAKVTALTALTSVSTDDIFPVVDDPAGTPVTKKVTYANLIGSFGAVGQLPFPATAIPSATANTLDDYEEGTFTPAVTFTTPGDINVVYSSQLGRYVKIGNRVFISIALVTTTFTYTTSSGTIVVTGLPFTSANPSAGMAWMCASQLTRYTAAGYTQVQFYVSPNATTMASLATGTGAVSSPLGPGNVPSATLIAVYASGHYEV